MGYCDLVGQPLLVV